MKILWKWNRWLASLYPKRCVLCEEVCPADAYFCTHCQDCMERIPPDVCPICQKALSQCHCKVFWKNCISFTPYGGQGKNVVLSMKIGGQRHAASFLAQGMAEALLKKYSAKDFDFITYVPSTHGKQKKRGFNPAQWLAEGVAEILKLPLQNNLLFRQSTSKTQHELTSAERQQNARTSYGIKQPPPKNSRILLVDDVVTTGATLNEIVRLLLEAGADSVVCLTAAVTKWQESQKKG